MNSLFLGAWILAFFAPNQAPPPPAARELDFVSVASPNNPKDKNGYGQVGYVYKVTRRSIDNEIYARFLNAADSSGGNARALYNPLMGSTNEGGISFDPTGKAGEKYRVKPGMGKNPVVYVSWPDAARLANWLSNGGQRGSSTEIGAYNLRAAKGQLTARMPAARYAVANPDELYKAAFYLPTGFGKATADQLYASVTAAVADLGGRGAIDLPILNGKINELVDPLNVSAGQPQWAPANQTGPVNLSFAGTHDPNAENAAVSFHLVDLRNGQEIANDDGANDQQYAGAPALDNTSTPAFFPSGGGGGAVGNPLSKALLNTTSPSPSS